MIVVSNTSPLNYLVLIDAVEYLFDLYEAVYVPIEVVVELSAEGTPATVAAWTRNPPAWIRIVQSEKRERLPGLDDGESAAIHLAREIHADLILME